MRFSNHPKLRQAKTLLCKNITATPIYNNLASLMNVSFCQGYIEVWQNDYTTIGGKYQDSSFFHIQIDGKYFNSVAQLSALPPQTHII